ncbi:MAG TPA: TolC family protein [Saprospiraceae bacterium]|nr:TolC family protein [Saprospiraceae bacterium]
MFTKNIPLTIWLWFAGLLCLSAQQEPLQLNEYLDLVTANHPLVRQANLLNLEAEAYELKARGSFDPKLMANFDQKTFDGKDYFTVGQTELKIPTWYGVELKAGYNWAEGGFLNPEEELPAAGQAVLGLNVNLLQGMLIDQRRASLRQAQLLNQQNEQERRAMINEILIDANETYWDWVYAYNRLQIYEEAYRLAVTRFGALRESYIQGYKAAVDTLESSIQVQSRFTALQEAQLKLETARLKLSNYLWTSDDIPLELSPNVPAPVLEDMDFLAIPRVEIDSLRNQIFTQHPALQALNFKLDQLAVQNRLNREMLKPRLELSYNFLADGWNFNGYQSAEQGNLRNILTENYKLGLQFSFPLFLRKERANIALNEIKTQNTSFKLLQKRLSLQNKFGIYENTASTLLSQIEQYDAMVQNYRDLLAAENEKFRLGSSSLFLINSREQKLIESQEKLLKTQASFHKTRVAIRAVAGLLAN